MLRGHKSLRISIIEEIRPRRYVFDLIHTADEEFVMVRAINNVKERLYRLFCSIEHPGDIHPEMLMKRVFLLFFRSGETSGSFRKYLAI